MLNQQHSVFDYVKTMKKVTMHTGICVKVGIKFSVYIHSFLALGQIKINDLH